MQIEFNIPGRPQGKARPKVTMRGGYAHAYTPKKTVDYENYVKERFQKAQLRSKSWQNATDKPLEIAILAFYKIPKSKSLAKTLERCCLKIKVP